MTAYAIDIDTINLIAVLIEHYGTLLNRQQGQTLSVRVVETQQMLLDCVADSRRARPLNALQAPETRADASQFAQLTVREALSVVGIIDLATGAIMLDIKPDSARDLCRRDQLDCVKIAGTYLTSISAVERRKTQQEALCRAK